MPTTDRAICLRAVDFSETSQVVHLLTRAGGVVRLLAKGTKRAKSKAGGAIDLFSEGEVVFAGAGREALGTLMEYVEDTDHAGLRRRLDRLHAGLYMLEAAEALLAEGDPHAEVFDLLHAALARLEQPDAAPPAVLAYFQWRLARHVGLLGQMQECATCGAGILPAFSQEDTPKQTAPLGGKLGGATRGICFSSSAGGLLCRNCAAAATEKRPASPDTLAGLAALAAAEAAVRKDPAARRVKLPDAQAAAVNGLLAYHIQYQLGRRLKTARHALGR